MDKFWHSLRIGCISIFAVIALGVGSCTAINWLDEYAKDRMRDTIWARSTNILGQKKSHHSTVKFSDLFGDDIDGVCVVFDGRAFEDNMRQVSPAKFGPAIHTIMQQPNRRSGLDSDTYYWFVYAVKDAKIERKYELVVKSYLDIDSDGAGRCYDIGAPVELIFYPRNSYGDESLIIKIPPVKVEP